MSKKHKNTVVTNGMTWDKWVNGRKTVDKKPQYVYPEATKTIATSEWVTSYYHHALRMAGAKVLTVTENTLLTEFDKCDGLLLPGGVDISPTRYGQAFHAKTQNPNRMRDAMELGLLKRALENDMPVLGVCRGHQLINVALGGTLIQHVNGHVTSKHPIKMLKDANHLAYLETDMYVNSLHHQVIDKLGDGLAVAALSHDDEVEAIESKDHKFVVGVQWHPEMYCTDRFDREMTKLWDKFLHAKEA